MTLSGASLGVAFALSEYCWQLHSASHHRLLPRTPIGDPGLFWETMKQDGHALTLAAPDGQLYWCVTVQGKQYKAYFEPKTSTADRGAPVCFTTATRMTGQGK